MSLDKTVEELKAKAEEMGQYYYKGFGFGLDCILSSAEMYLLNPEREELASASYKYLDEFIEFYEKIPFDDLHGREEFYPLFVARRLIPGLRAAMDRVFEEQDPHVIPLLREQMRTFLYVGDLFFQEFIDAVGLIREHEGEENYRITVPAHYGETYEF